MSTQAYVGNIPTFSAEQLAYLASLNQTNPTALAAINKGTHPMCALMAQTPAAAKPSEPVALSKVGDVVADRGVYLGEWAGVHAYAAEDFLRDAKGKQLLLKFNQARAEFAERNNGWEAGDSTEAAIRAEIAKGGNAFEGKLIIPPLELVNGYDVQANRTHPEGNIYTLMNAGKLPKVAEAVQNGKGDQQWALSGSERPDVTSRVYHVSLPGGDAYWYPEDGYRSAAVPVRLYRPPAVTEPAPQVVG